MIHKYEGVYSTNAMGKSQVFLNKTKILNILHASLTSFLGLSKNKVWKGYPVISYLIIVDVDRIFCQIERKKL